MIFVFDAVAVVRSYFFSSTLLLQLVVVADFLFFGRSPIGEGFLEGFSRLSPIV
jgi:hypothetical protein